MRLPTPPPVTPLHRQEQLKLAARGLSILAVFVLVAVLAGPMLNPALTATPGQQLGGVLLAVALFGLGLMLLGRIPVDDEPNRQSDKR